MPFHDMSFLVNDMFCTLDKKTSGKPFELGWSNVANLTALHSAGSYALANTCPFRESTIVTKFRDGVALSLGNTSNTLDFWFTAMREDAICQSTTQSRQTAIRLKAISFITPNFNKTQNPRSRF